MYKWSNLIFLKVRITGIFFAVAIFLIASSSCDKKVSRSPVEPDISHGMIKVSSTPAGATIFLNGRNTGRLTPDSLSYLYSGNYDIKLKIQYYKDTSVTVSLGEEEHINVDIDYLSNPSMYGNLIFYTVPTGASIFLNDSSLNRTTPDTLLGMLPGLYKATFKHENFRDAEITVLVESSITRNYSTSLVDTSVWVSYQKSNSDIPSDLLTSIEVDNNGVKWIGTSDKGLIRYNGINFENFNISNSGIPSDKINCIAISNSNEILLGTPVGLTVFNGVTWNVFNKTNSNLPNDDVNCIKYDLNGNAWVGTNNGFAKFDGVNLVAYNYSSSQFGFLWVTDLSVDANNVVWLGSNNYGILSYKNNVFTEYVRSAYNFPTNKISAVEVNNNDIWFGHLPDSSLRSGISIYNHNTFMNLFPGSSTLKVNDIEIEEINNNKWISTSEGVYSYDANNQVGHYNTFQSQLSSDNVSEIALDDIGNIWIATFGGGLNKFKIYNQ